MMAAYTVLLTVSAPVLALLWMSRWVRGRESWADLRERLGGDTSAAPPGPALWLHAASVGEVTAARPVAEALLARAPRLTCLVTCNTTSGRSAVERWQHPRVSARLAPYDLKICVRPLLCRWSVRAAIIVENELWPNRLSLLHDRGVPIAVIGARLSARSARRWGRLRGLIAPQLARLAFVAPQDAASAGRLMDLGVKAERLGSPVSLKAAVTLAAPHAEEVAALGYSRDETLLAASTHPGEEEMILAAFQLARRARPDLRLIIAPRHPERGAALARLISAQGLSSAQRSRGEVPGTSDVYLADTLGEMALWYAASGLCFVGGSLVPKGGHTPHEPAQFGSAILHGPHTENAGDAYARLAAAGAAERVEDPQALGAALIGCDTARQRDMATRARAALAEDDLSPLIDLLLQKLAL